MCFTFSFFSSFSYFIIIINITAAVRLIGSFAYIIEPLRAPRAALGQPRQRDPKSSRTSPWPAKSRPEANFPNLIEKPYESHETSLKKSKKHCARAQSGSQVPRIAVKSSFLELEPDLADLPEVVAGAAARTLPSMRAGGQNDSSFNKLP